MHRHLLASKNLWNELLAHAKYIFEETSNFPKKDELQSMAKGKGLYSQTQQSVSHKVFESIKRVFVLRKKGVRVGFPRFKNFDRAKSLYYPQSGFKLVAKLKVSPFGEIAIKKHREIKGRIKTLTLKRESSGKWFAIFTAEESTLPKKNAGEQVGIDLGLKSFAAFSDGAVIPNPRHLKRREAKLMFLQRKLSRCRKGSKNRFKAKLKVVLLHERIANARADFLHKLSTKITSFYSKIVLEKLASKEMCEKQFGKSIHDAGWSMFADMIRYKAESAGCEVVFVNPKNTTKECSKCGALSEKTLLDRMHNCPVCGYLADRDLNAAQVILKRATAGHAGCNACEVGAIVPSMKQEIPCFFKSKEYATILIPEKIMV